MSARFSDDVTVITFNKVEASDRIQLWYQPADYKSLKQQNAGTLKMAKAGETFQDSRTHCIRGLENSSSHKKQECDDRRMEAFLVVMEEQKRLKSQGISDGFAAAKVYRQETTEARHTAIARGQKDEKVQKAQEMADEATAVAKPGIFKRPRIKRNRSDEAAKGIQAAAKMRSSLRQFSRKISFGSS